MNLKLTRVEVWAAELDDQPGTLALTLQAITDRDADLDFVLARRDAGRPGKGLVFVSPLTTRQQVENAGKMGLRLASEIAVLKVEGTNGPGVGATIAKAIANVGINLNAVSTAASGHHFVCHIAFDSVHDREKAEAALNTLTNHAWRFWERHHATTAAA
jgi:hypothetical protein